MQIKNIIAEIEAFAPLKYQESYDNSGVQVGNQNQICTGVLLTLDVTEAVIAEVLENNCNLIICHHPLLFSGLKNITGKNYVERCVITAIQHNLVIYAAHTNLDNVNRGVNHKICQKLGLMNTRILQKTQASLIKLFTYVPHTDAEKLRQALFSAGAGHIGPYSECSFNIEGKGTFRPGESTNPTIGTAGGPREEVEEIKMEFLVPSHLQNQVLATLLDSHPYEEVAYEFIPLLNENQYLGAGMVGELPEALSADAFLALLKTNMNAQVVRYTTPPAHKINRVAVCGGSGSFLLKNAMAAQADAFVTADFKYHQFFDAEGKIMIADIGHFESEQFTVEIFKDLIKEKFPNFAVYLSKVNTNPINYYT